MKIHFVTEPTNNLPIAICGNHAIAYAKDMKDFIENWKRPIKSICKNCLRISEENSKLNNMELSEINVKNVLLGEFLGRRGKHNKYLFTFKGIEQNNDIWFNQNELEFHSNWNWLMLVVAKIRTIEISDLSSFTLNTGLIAGDRNQVYEECVRIVNCYNTKKVK